MNFKKICLIIVFSLLISLFSFSVVIADEEEEFIDPDIPESWYEAPQKASEMDINEFNQSPMLDEKVEEGELPPVEERLPDDPPVIEPLNEVGEYGGTLTTWSEDLDWWLSDGQLFNQPSKVVSTPYGEEILPTFIKGWEFSNDAKELTFYLREGLKWSDGEDVTAEDYLYWWKYEANYEELNSVPPTEWSPPIIDLVKEDEYTVTIKYGTPVPRRLELSIGEMFIPPSHFLKQFHPEYIGKEKVLEMAKEVDLETFEELYGRISDDNINYPEEDRKYGSPPRITPYIVVERAETYLILERNPYFYFVDTEGNQLPYIDKIRINLAEDKEIIRTKSATGETDFAAWDLSPKQLPLYKKAQGKEPIKTLVWNYTVGAMAALQLNMTHEDPKIRELHQNRKFRIALSHSIDRERINNFVYYGEGKVMQATVPPTTKKYYNSKYANAYIEYDPEKSKEILDEIGLKDYNDDGWRELPNKEKYNPVLLINGNYPTSHLEMMTKNFQDVGINVELRKVSWQLHSSRRRANNFDWGSWTIDSVTTLGLGCPNNTMKMLAPTGGWAAYTPWTQYVHYYASGGEEGEEPPANIKELNEAAKIMTSAVKEEEVEKAAEFLLEQQAKNLWVIGSVGMTPQPIIISEDLKNVPNIGLWEWSLKYLDPYYPFQFYLDR